MYLFQRSDFRIVDTTQVVQFVECWERYYRGDIRLSDSEKVINYFIELNLGHDLTEQNLIRLLRWKDQRMLTHPKKPKDTSVGAPDEPNPRVMRVLEEIKSINGFRKGDVTELDFKKVTKRVFRSGIVWQLFLFHIARPHQWPIADQHVFRVYSALYGAATPKSIENFRAYVQCFNNLAVMFRNELCVNDQDLTSVVEANKRLDNALMAFGQFLSAYDK